MRKQKGFLAIILAIILATANIVPVIAEDLKDVGDAESVELVSEDPEETDLTLIDDEVVEEETADEETTTEADDELYEDAEDEYYEDFYYCENIDDLEVEITAPAGVFHEEVYVTVEKIDIPVEDMAELLDDESVVDSYTFDINFYNENDEIVEPDTEYGTVSVAVRGIEMPENSEQSLVNLSDDLTEVIEEIEIAEVNSETEEIVFEAEHFTVYTIVVHMHDDLIKYYEEDLGYIVFPDDVTVPIKDLFNSLVRVRNLAGDDLDWHTFNEFQYYEVARGDVPNLNLPNSPMQTGALNDSTTINLGPESDGNFFTVFIFLSDDRSGDFARTNFAVGLQNADKTEYIMGPMVKGVRDGSTFTISGWGSMFHITPLTNTFPMFFVPFEKPVYNDRFNKNGYANWLKTMVINPDPGGISFDIMNYAFSSLLELETVTVNGEFPHLPHGMFSNCPSLEEVVFDGYVEYGGNEVFKNDISLKKISFLRGVGEGGSAANTQLRADTFSGCTSLEEVVFGGEIAIEDGCFEGCKNLETIVLDHVKFTRAWELPYVFCDDEGNIYKEIPITAGTSWGDRLNTTLHRMDWEIGNPRAADVVAGLIYVNGVDESDGYKLIIAGTGNTCECTRFASNGGEWPWYDYIPDIKEVVVSEGVTYLGGSVAKDGSSLEAVYLPDSLTGLGSHAFDACNSLNKLYIGGRDYTNAAVADNSALTTIGTGAFWGCSSLPLAKLPAGITELGRFAFNACTSLAITSLPQGITEIPNETFDGCENMPLVLDGNSTITTIGSRAFYNCKKLTVVNGLPSGLASIGDWAFYNCELFDITEVPSGVTALPERVFYGTAITELKLTGTKGIGTNAFPINSINKFTLENVKLTSSGNLPGTFYRISNGEQISTLSAGVTYNDVLVKTPHYQVIVKDNGSTHTYVVPKNSTIAAVDPSASGSWVTVKENYNFDGWKSSADSTVYTTEELANKTITAGDTYTAQFSAKDSYTVTFNLYDTEPAGMVRGQRKQIDSRSYFSGDDLVVPGDPILKSYNGEMQFTGWDPATVSPVTGAATYTAQFTLTTPVQYHYVWYDWNDNVLKEDTNTYENVDKTAPATPKRDPEGDIAYRFYRWDDVSTLDDGYEAWFAKAGKSSTDVIEVAKKAFYTETEQCTITFRNYDGTLISSKVQAVGTRVYAPSKTPLKAQTNDYSYEFTGWSPEIVSPCEGDAEYIAQFKETERLYTVTFRDYNNTVLSTNSYHYNDYVALPNTPERESTPQYTYTFKAWSPTCTENTKVTKDAEYRATYTQTDVKYNVKFINSDTGVTISSKDYKYNDRPVAPTSVKKAATESHTYELAGWTPEIKPVTEDAEYQTVWKETAKKFEITFNNYDGKQLSRNVYEYGQKVSVPTATRAEDSNYTYEFSGWTPTLDEVAVKSVTYKANFTSTRKPTPTPTPTPKPTPRPTETPAVTIRTPTPTPVPTRTPTPVPATPSKPATVTVEWKFVDDDDKVITTIKAAVGTSVKDIEEKIPHPEPKIKSVDDEVSTTEKSTDKKTTTSTNKENGKTVENNKTAVSGVRSSGETLYIFDHWDPEIPETVEKAMTFKAVYKESTKPTPTPTPTPTPKVTPTPTPVPKVKEYTVTFADMNDNVISTIKVPEGQDVKEFPEPPVVESYRFLGWSDDGKKIMEDRRILALYEGVSYTVTFVDMNDNVISTCKVLAGHDIPTFPEPPEFDGYNFTGWSDDGKMITEDRRIQALYEKSKVPMAVGLISAGVLTTGVITSALFTDWWLLLFNALLLKRRKKWHGLLTDEENKYLKISGIKDGQDYSTLQMEINKAHDEGLTLEQLRKRLEESKITTTLPLKTMMAISIVSVNGTDVSPDMEADENKLYDYLSEYEGKGVTALVDIFNNKTPVEIKLEYKL